jgi:hypothetical protein
MQKKKEQSKTFSFKIFSEEKMVGFLSIINMILHHEYEHRTNVIYPSQLHR